MKDSIKIRWCVMRGDVIRLASQKLYSFRQARRFERLARRWGLDVYAARFGKIRYRKE